ncbi:taste receptor type 2 member 50-like [Hyperolius riggenbachi]|uniref:taste receptor type 2 member 50-like n=1 Tax=Hyperolius riggenbachi TaxID=752182 RepID=UPI0035A2E868
MANYTEETCYQNIIDSLILVAPFFLLSLAGLFTGTFIVAVNVTDWLKQRTMTAANQIITSLGLSRIILHILSIIDLFFTVCSEDPFETSSVLFFIYVTAVFSTVWLSVLLFFFFCFTISTFRSVFFLRLKTIISQRVTSLIIVFLLLSFGFPVMTFLMVPLLPCSGNSTEDDSSCDRQTDQFLTTLYAVWNFFPLLVFFISSILLVISLSSHVNRMKTRTNETSNTGTFYRTITFTVVSFLTFAFYITVAVAASFDLKATIPYFIDNIFPTLHSLTLIYVTTKLKNQFLQVICCKVECLFSRKAPEPNSRVQVEMIHIPRM